MLLCEKDECNGNSNPQNKPKPWPTYSGKQQKGTDKGHTTLGVWNSLQWQHSHRTEGLTCEIHRQTHTRADLALKLHRWESRNRHSSSSCYVKRPQAPPSTRQTVLQTSPSPCAVAAKRVGCCSYKSQCLHLQKKVIFLIVHRMSICKYQEY